MERPQTPPNSGPAEGSSRADITPEVKRRIEENRLRAKARREQLEAEQRHQGGPEINRTPSGFLAPVDDSLAGRKRTHSTIASTPDTNRDARNEALSSSNNGAVGAAGGITKPRGDSDIQAARKFAKYVEYDFSKMTDTKGGFLAAEDDPHNKALHSKVDTEPQKPAHMSLKEWERHRLLKSLQERRAGPFEPGQSVLAEQNKKKCRECKSIEIDYKWEEVFGCAICKACKEKFPDKYSLLTKTEAKEDYLLTDPELRDEELLPHLNKPNPHKSHWHDMMLFLRYQVEEYAFTKKWGSAEALDAEFEKREVEKKRRKEEKFRTKLQELKKKTRAEAYRRNMKAGGSAGAFGDRIGSGKHEHIWGQTVENEDGMTVKSCTECGMEVEELEF